MSPQISLKKAEQKVFQTTYRDGLWDVYLGCFFLIFVIAPYLSTSLGDFWSAFVFIPFNLIVYLAIRLVRKHVVNPRIGIVKFGQARKVKLSRFTNVMLAVNVIALILGIFAALNFARVPGQVFSIIIGFIFLTGFSIAAFLLDFSRLYVYGLLAGLSPPIGEWLFAHGFATHHGFPITFGITAGIMILTGLILFLRLLFTNPVPEEAIPLEPARDGKQTD